MNFDVSLLVLSKDLEYKIALWDNVYEIPEALNQAVGNFTATHNDILYMQEVYRDMLASLASVSDILGLVICSARGVLRSVEPNVEFGVLTYNDVFHEEQRLINLSEHLADIFGDFDIKSVISNHKIVSDWAYYNLPADGVKMPKLKLHQRYIASISYGYLLKQPAI